MQYNGPTFRVPPTVPERLYPARVVVETTLRVWAFSRQRGPVELANAFLRRGIGYLLAASPVMFHTEEVRGNRGIPLIAILTHFTNPFDGNHLSQVSWCGCDFISVTTYNVFTDLESIFPTTNRMHTLPYKPEG